jgi:hypothetical protein
MPLLRHFRVIIPMLKILLSSFRTWAIYLIAQGFITSFPSPEVVSYLYEGN